MDGYNVIHADPALARLASQDLDLARARLIESLARFAETRSLDVTVVFDAARATGTDTREEWMLGIRVIFSPQGRSADSVLEALAHAAVTPRDVTVATSDRATQEAVFGRGAMRMSARELVSALGQPDEEAAEAPPKWRATVADRLDRELVDRLRELT